MKALVILLIGFAASAQQFGVVTLTGNLPNQNLVTKPEEIRIFRGYVGIYLPRVSEFCRADNLVLSNMGIQDNLDLEYLLKNERLNVTCSDGINAPARLTNAEITKVEFKVNAPIGLETGEPMPSPMTWTLLSIRGKESSVLGIHTYDAKGTLTHSYYDSTAKLSDMDLPSLVEELNSGRAKISVSRGLNQPSRISISREPK